MNRGHVTKQLTRYGREALRNAIALLQDAIWLYEQGRFGSAYYMATTSAEEVGKCLIANDCVFNWTINQTDIHWTVKWLQMSLSHVRKQVKFARETIEKMPVDFVKLVLNQQLDAVKQRSLYVDIDLRSKGRHFRVTTPSRVTEPAARRQIALVHEGICDMIRGSVEYYYTYEIGDRIAPLNRKTLNYVKKMWGRNYKLKRVSFRNEELRQSGLLEIGK